VVIAKKAAAKPVKTVIKKTAHVAAKTEVKKAVPAKVITKRNDSALKAKTAKIKETKTKVKEAKGKVKAPAQSTASAKPTPKPAVDVQPGKAITKPRRKLALPIQVAPTPEPPRRSVTSGALRAFEHSVRVFNRRHFEEAKSLFEALLSKFPAEVELIARSQMYIQVCSQKMAQVQTTPRNADELYDHGVYALNIGDFTQAKTFFEKALRLKPDEAHLLYSLAATHAQTGSMDQALDYLKRTLQVQPRYRFQALNDTDFSGLRENKQFLELIGLASPFDLLQSRR
jgi:tetratricopeptide (TPR) repeat protein